MLRVVIGFFRGIWSLGPFWRGWVGLLILANGITPLFFLGTIEARVVLGVFLVGAGLQMIIFRFKGFVRLLGAGHVAWVPMIWWLWPRLGAAGSDGPFGLWLAAVIALDLASLLIDTADVVRYALGDRRPSLTMEEMR